jgi:hypothetical protein
MAGAPVAGGKNLLRALLGEPPREWEPLLRETADALDKFIRLCRERLSGGAGAKARFRTFAVWAEGLRRSLDELEESLFAARFFAGRIETTRWDEMSPAAKLDYDRHVYFDKNAYIRIFSLLDKLGTLLNTLLDLQTEKIKVHFSYYTVLRHMRETGRHTDLADQLVVVKDRHREAMSRLRTRRNMEIHYMNAELQDDLAQGLTAGEGEGGRLENLSANLADSDEGWQMVRDTLGRTFKFANGWVRRLP